MGQCANDATTKGVVLLRGTDQAGTSYNQVASFRNSGGFGVNPTAEMKETTNSDDDWKTYRRGIKDGGEFTPTLDYKPDDPGQGLMKSDWVNQDCPWPYMILSTVSARGLKFDALIGGWGPDFNFSEQEISRNVTIKISGAVEETAVAPTIDAIV